MAVTRGKVFETIRRHSQRTGVTLVELLVAIALTLMVILAVVRVFDLLGGNVTQSRSILEMAARTRTVADQLQMDLSQLTLKPIPPVDPASAPGYFEIIEGIRSERDPDGDGTFLPNLTQFVFRNDPVPNTFVVYPTFETFATVSNESVSFPPSPPTGPSAIINPTFLQEIYGVLGDTDDIWMGTIRSSGEPFRGRITDPTTGNVIQVESPLAEIAWWIEPIPGPQGSPPGAYGLALIRRVFLILPNLNVNGFLPGRQIDSPAEVQQFLAFNDVSVRFNGGRVIANSLADLTERRNRFAHWATPGFDLVNRLYLVRAMDRIVLPDGSISSRLNGSDLISSDLVAFDLRVYDPLAPIFLSPRQTGVVTPYALTPVDAGFYNLVGNITSNPPLGYGAYVDLGYLFSSAPANTPVVSHFSARPHPRSGILLNPLAPRVYCTWSARYERDGIDQDGDGLIDEGTNGLDDPPGSLAVDDTDEQETSPPYPAPLRGMEIILRTRDASTQQVRQSSIVADFVTH